MRVFRDIDQLPKIRNCVVTTGSFDGVHIGHKTLINRLNEIARKIDGESVLITFYPHVRKVLYPDSVGKDLELISSQREKIELLEQTGLDNLVIINFTREFAQISAEDFVRNILVGKLGARVIVVGFNHYFGHNREGNFEKLAELGRELGFEVVEIPPQELERETVGSTRIRKSLKEGKIMHANAYLDHIFFIYAEFIPGSPVYHSVGFPTLAIKVEDENKLIPPDGIYAVSVELEKERYKGMMMNNYHGSYHHPDLRQQAEIHLPEREMDFVGRSGKVYVHKEITRELKFDDLQALKRKLSRARKTILELIY